jgi:S-adenosylmethionine/arginine decarboxylase-like enzyme
MEYWGYHLILDCSGSPQALVTDRDHIHRFALEMVEKIDMVAYGEPIIEHFATHDPDKAGYTLVQLIETSNITAHFVDKDGSFYMDIFSCKPFKNEDAIGVVEKFFRPEKIKVHFITRNAD